MFCGASVLACGASVLACCASVLACGASVRFYGARSVLACWLVVLACWLVVLACWLVVLACWLVVLACGSMVLARWLVVMEGMGCVCVCAPWVRAVLLCWWCVVHVCAVLVCAQFICSLWCVVVAVLVRAAVVMCCVPVPCGWACYSGLWLWLGSSVCDVLFGSRICWLHATVMSAPCNSCVGSFCVTTRVEEFMLVETDDQSVAAEADRLAGACDAPECSLPVSRNRTQQSSELAGLT
jgi:hypothetical protein